MSRQFDCSIPFDDSLPFVPTTLFTSTAQFNLEDACRRGAGHRLSVAHLAFSRLSVASER